MIGASGGLFLLQETYNFNLTEFAMGRIRIPEAQVREQGGTEYYVEDSPLTTHDLEILGKIAFNRDHFDRAYEFFKVHLALILRYFLDLNKFSCRLLLGKQNMTKRVLK